MFNKIAGVRLFDGSLDVLQLPLLDIEIGFNGFIQYIRAVTVQGFGYSIKGTHFFSVETKSYGLLFHIIK